MTIRKAQLLNIIYKYADVIKKEMNRRMKETLKTNSQPSLDTQGVFKG